MFNLDIYEYYEDINFGLLKYRPADGKKVLDVGCGNGLMGELYRKTGNSYYGIDQARDMEEKANKRLNGFYCADVTDFIKIKKLLKKEKFDIIIFADILEHLVDPVSVVNFYKGYLAKNGLIYISVPNIAVWYVRMWILLGKFDYGPCGVLDRTHLRFFTKNNLLKLGKVCGLINVNLDITPGVARFFQYSLRNMVKKNSGSINRRGWIDSPIYKFYVKYIYNLEYIFCKIAPGLLAYQHIGIFKQHEK